MSINKINLDGNEFEVGGGGKAKFLGRFYLSEIEYQLNTGTYTDTIFKLNEPLKQNHLYLIKYYNDEWGSVGQTVIRIGQDEKISYILRPNMIALDDAENFVSVNYNFHFNPQNMGDKEKNHSIKISHLKGEDLVELIDDDYIEIYELPLTMEVV